MKILYLNQLHPHETFLSKDEHGREINIYKINNCIATGLSLFYPNVLLQTDSSIILPLLEKTMSLGITTIYEKNNMIYDVSDIICTIKCSIPVFFFIYNTDNYFHFVYDSLPYLITYLHLKKSIPELKVLMQYPNEQRHTFYPFVVEFLELLHIGHQDIIIVDPYTIYESIYFSTSYTHDIDSNLPPRNEIYPFYQSIVKHVVNTYPIITTPKKIYISRRTWLHNDFSNIGTNYTMRRRMINEDNYVEHLIKQGYTEVFTEKLSTIEKIFYFANATHVIGAIGGGISNVLFSLPTVHLEAIISPTFLDVNMRFKYSLECVYVYYNMNTEHIEEGSFKTYMRIKVKRQPILGEIEKIERDILTISYTDGSNTGWNAQSQYKQMTVFKDDVEPLDNGLNSPWRLTVF